MKNISNVMKLPGCSVGNGQYRYELRGPAGEIKQEIGWTDNLLTNLGVVTLGTNQSAFVQGYCGTGNTPPAYTDTLLDAVMPVSDNAVTISTVHLGLPTYGVETSYKYVYETGDNTGTITEFGAGPDYDEICMRVVFPAPIVKGALDELTIYYKYYMYADLNDVVGVVNIEGVPYNYTARVSNIDQMVSGSKGGVSNSGYFAITWCHIADMDGAAYDAANLVPITSAIGTSDGTAVQRTAYVSGSVVGDGSSTVVHTNTSKWDIDTGNDVGVLGVRAVYFLPGWANGHPDDAHRIQVIIGRVSDGAPHPKEDTHELRLSYSVTTNRIP